MRLRLPFVMLTASGLAGCAAAGSSDTVTGSSDSGPATTADGGGSTDDANGGQPGPTGPTGPTGPGVFDSGPPATIGGEDAGLDSAIAPDTGGALSDGGCTTLAECPYGSAPNVQGVSCVAGACVITCAGENYDVNGVLSDGCEVAGIVPASQGNAIPPVDHHTQSLAANAGSYPCDDGSSMQNMTGNVPSDDRAHIPAIDGFVSATGAAPDYFSINATGGTFCQDDANLNLQINAPSKQLACYVLNLLTNKNGGQTCQTTLTGHCSITNGTGSYGDGSTIYVWVSKAASCTAAGFPDDATFQITGHL